MDANVVAVKCVFVCVKGTLDQELLIGNGKRERKREKVASVQRVREKFEVGEEYDVKPLKGLVLEWSE